MRFRELVVIILLLLAACGNPDRGSDRSIVPPLSTVVIAYDLAIPTLGVLHSSDSMAGQVQREMLFMPLVKLNAAFEPEPWLAESWDTVRFSVDSLELTFQLRDDVAWHDGVPTTAEDVRFTFDRIMDPRTGAIPRRLFSLYNPRAEVVDSRTIRFRLRASGDFLGPWSAVPPLASHILHDVPPEELAAHRFGREPTGNGPFMFGHRAPPNDWVFEANPDFPAALGGRPHMDRVVIRTIPDPTTRLSELLTGGVHLAPVQAARIEEVREGPDVRVVDMISPRWTAIFWNTRLPQFTDARVRRALTMALNRQEIMDAALYGYGMAGGSPITPFHSFFAPTEAEEPSLPFDRSAALALLAEAGWSVHPDGLLRDEQGSLLDFPITVISDATQHRDAAQVVQAQLSVIGVRVRIQPVEYTTLLQQASAGPDGSRAFHALIMSVAGERRKDDSFFFHSRHRDEIGHFSGFSSPRLDEILDALVLSPDHAYELPLWREYQRLLTDEAPVTVLFYPLSLLGVAIRLEGVEATGINTLNNVTRWSWIDP